MYDPRSDISAYLDGELPGDALNEFEAAMAADESLRAEVERLRAVDGIYRADTSAVPPTFADDVFGAIHAEQNEPRNVVAFPLRTVIAMAAGLVLVVGLYLFTLGEDDAPMMEMAAVQKSSESMRAEQPDAIEEAEADNLAPSEPTSSDVVLGQRLVVELEMSADEDAMTEVDGVRGDRVAMNEAAPPLPAPPVPAAEPAASAPKMAADPEELSMAAADRPAIEAESPSSLADDAMPSAGVAVGRQALEGAAQRQRAAAAPAEKRMDENAELKEEAKKDVGALRTIGTRRFELREAGWFEVGYADEDTKAVTSDDLEGVISDGAIRRELMGLGEVVVFRAGGVWYRFAAVDE